MISTHANPKAGRPPAGISSQGLVLSLFRPDRLLEAGEWELANGKKQQ
jgi:hypothetical protein